jgi:hypothetical protein
MTDKKKNVFFLCSPHIGIIDNWLPVLWELKKEIGKNYHFICVVPKSSWINKSALSNALIKLSDIVFDEIIFNSVYDQWVSTNSFVEAEAVLKFTRTSDSFSKLAEKLKQNALTKYIGIALKKIWHFKRKYSLRKKEADLEIIFDNTAVLIYDLAQELKMDNKIFVDNLKKVPKFSLFHGLITHPVDFKTEYAGKYTTENVTAYLFSEEEIAHYKERFGLKDNQIKVVGVPRHNPEWINTLISYQNDMEFNKYGEFIFIISRPYGSKMLPRKRMKSTLQEIKKIAFGDLDLNIVVKLHPSELKQDLYEEVFGESEKNVKWFYSSSHPFVLGKNAMFAISFYSGIAVDLISMGVPVIEKIDLRNIEIFEQDDSMKDNDGEPVLRYRYYNLLLGASSNEQLRNHAEEIVSNRVKVLDKLKLNYNKVYPTIKDVNKTIALDIINSFETD